MMDKISIFGCGSIWREVSYVNWIRVEDEFLQQKRGVDDFRRLRIMFIPDRKRV